MVARIVVLASGSGTNLQAIIDACSNGSLSAEVVAVVSDQPDAYALERARTHHIAAIALPRHDTEKRAEYDVRLRAAVAEHMPDWIVLAGFMRLLSATFLDHFAGQVINLHPALPGDLPGTHAIERAFAQHLIGLRTESGVMVHLVPDDGVDDGPVLATATIRFETDDTLESFASRVHTAERQLLVDTLITLTKETAR
jgi:phosphoribosylglycinamide formyltransferase 1